MDKELSELRKDNAALSDDNINLKGVIERILLMDVFQFQRWKEINKN
tara:strand:- start:30605 stop:30745 length:141 start_codon:yes stop_codon:yes gene_type:complete